MDFASFWSYCPKGDNEVAKKSRDITYALKDDRTPLNEKVTIQGVIVRKLKEQIDSLPFKDFFGSEVYLVPVPKSSLMQKDTLWVPKKLVESMTKHNLGRAFDCLERIETVTKSSSSHPKNRLKPIDHYKTIRVNIKIERPENILLVDDVLTRGSTLLGCASKLKEAFPEANIRAFAAIRTISNPNYFEKIEDFHIGQIVRSPDGTSSTT
ncbi:MAG: hypothetical protein WC595_03695 [Candidatus Nanoarchaeia archaeon]